LKSIILIIRSGFESEIQIKTGFDKNFRSRFKIGILDKKNFYGLASIGLSGKAIVLV
jgi:hypothetical protein